VTVKHSAVWLVCVDSFIYLQFSSHNLSCCPFVLDGKVEIEREAHDKYVAKMSLMVNNSVALIYVYIVRL
jgi:hypothetical protein